MRYAWSIFFRSGGKQKTVADFLSSILHYIYKYLYNKKIYSNKFRKTRHKQQTSIKEGNSFVVLLESKISCSSSHHIDFVINILFYLRIGILYEYFRATFIIINYGYIGFRQLISLYFYQYVLLNIVWFRSSMKVDSSPVHFYWRFFHRKKK